MKRLLLGLAALLALSSEGWAEEFVTIGINLNRFTLGQQPKGGTGGQPNPTVQPMSSGGQTAVDPDPTQPRIWAYANIPVKKISNVPHPAYAHYLVLEHHWGVGKAGGKTYLPGQIDPRTPWPKDTLQFTLRSKQVEPIAKQYADRVKRFLKDGKGKDHLHLLLLAEWALQHGLHGEFEKKMKELGALDAAHPVVVAFEQVYKQMKTAPAADDPVAQALMEDLKSEDYRPVVSDGGHYTLLTKLAAGDAGVKNRLARLEETYTNFFYWFALKGKTLPVPKYRLVVVLESTTKDFLSKHAAFDAPPMAADGFTIRRDNVIVMSPKRLDDVFTQLEKTNQMHWQNFKINSAYLISEINRKQAHPPGLTFLDVGVLQTCALVQRAMEEESERATATHEGTRQLLSATGLLPRNVAAGEWVRYGLASFFETPYHAFYPGTGLPSWTNLVTFHHLRKTGQLPDDSSKEVLRRTISDTYFHKAYGLQGAVTDGKGAKEFVGQQARAALEKAHATSWALVYHLLSQDGYTEGGKGGGKSENLNRLLGYLQELNNLPRDVEYNAAVLEGCFARAFGMLKDDNSLDMQKLQRLANACYSTMESTVLDVRGIEDEAMRQRYPPPLSQPAK